MFGLFQTPPAGQPCDTTQLSCYDPGTWGGAALLNEVIEFLVINDLPRGAQVDDIVYTIALTAIQAANRPMDA